MVIDLTKRGVRIEFVKEGLTFTSDDSHMSTAKGEPKAALARQFGISSYELARFRPFATLMTGLTRSCSNIALRAAAWFFLFHL